ncbi:hypothetical protein Tco_0978492 [Tanacetum coccineum]|uniref:Alpha-glucan water dikinase phosphohistidine-like domain-containing protein n=1 Tax=Tanacetum coccineum TaxID=301880 RepID=A0ABQ5EN81_9ASTR
MSSARQEKVTFVTCEDDDKIASIKNLEGKYVSLDASPSGVNVSPSSVKDNVRDSLVGTSSNGTTTDSVSKSIRSSREP